MAVLGVLLCTPSASAQAPEEDPLCGTTITKSVKLDRDVGCPLDRIGPTLTVGAPGITLDLGGHLVFGQIGILNSGHDRITIKNGEVGADYYGIQVIGAKRNSIRSITAHATRGSGVLLRASDYNSIADAQLSGEPGGLRLLESSDHNTVKDSQIGAFGRGLVIGESSHNLLIRNTFSGDASGLVIASGTRNAAIHNRANSAAEDGIEVLATATRTSLIGNRAAESEDGISVESPSTVLIANVANDNRDLGIEAVPGVFGVANRASGNGNPAQCLNVSCR